MVEMKNIRKFLLFKSLMASRPRISDKDNLSPFTAVGGVFERVKLNNPRTREAIAAIMKVFLKRPSETPSAESQ